MSIETTLCLAAQQVSAIQMSYAQKGLTLSQIALCGAKEFIEWQHYPRNDLVDEESGYEFYYHAHSADETPLDEHGHFHLFSRDARNPEEFCHLIAIALNQKGLPIRIFTTNQWVTGELYASAEEVLQRLRLFDMAIKGRMSRVAAWITAFTSLFYKDMEALILERDLVVESLSAELGGMETALESRRDAVLTQCNIDLMARLSENLLIEC